MRTLIKRFSVPALLIAGSLLPPAATAMSSEHYLNQVQKMYIAYYGRPGDPEGQRWWAGQLEQANGNFAAIVRAFGNSAEYVERYTALSDEQRINSIYQQLFGRDADSQGLAWYVERLSSGDPDWSLAAIALRIADGVQDGSSDAATLAARMDVANAFTQAADEDRFHYSGTPGINVAKNLINSVGQTHDSRDSAIQAIYLDTDEDGTPNLFDLDDDNDGIEDSADANPLIPQQSSGTAGGLLTAVTSEQQLLDSIRLGESNRSYVEYNFIAEDTAAIAEDASSPSAISTTYTQEASVDEHDYVKYDGNHLFIAPSRSLHCCFLVEPAIEFAVSDTLIAPEPSSEAKEIRILSTNVAQATAQEVASIPVDPNQTVEGLYLQNDRLITIHSTAWWGTYGSDFQRVSAWNDQQSKIQIYDISSPEAPALSWELEIDGGFVTSRRIGDKLYFLTRSTPYVEPLTSSDKSDTANNTEAELSAVIPRAWVNGTEQPLFAAEDCFVSNTEHDLAMQNNGYPTLTAITVIDLNAPDNINTTCYAESSSGAFVSPEAIYLTQYDYHNDQASTLVHRFSLSDPLQYDGSARVPGYLQTGGNSDFRISEHAGVLRLVTTQWTQDTDDRFDHRLYLLRPSAIAPELEIIAELPNNLRPDPIGKPNEDLYGVRFLGDRAFLVTFERTDPLYAIDLSNPDDPKIAGALEIPGFSDFLHPVSDELLLGLGEDEQRHVKLELFDISDISAPLSLGTLSLFDEANWSYSEARYNRHAFTYLQGINGPDRFSVPVNAGYVDSEGVHHWENRLYLAEIHNPDQADIATLQQAGYLSAEPINDYSYGSDRNRAVFHDDAVFYVHGDQVWSALWNAPFDQTGPQ